MFSIFVRMNASTRNPLIDDIQRVDVASLVTRTAFSAILEGRALDRDELMRATGAAAADVDRLVGRALMVDDSNRVVAAHGLSLVPARQHRLTLRGRHFWTWCAIDAVGIPAGLEEDATVETTCVQCGTEVHLELSGREVVAATHPDARIWEAARLEGRGQAGPPQCALMNLFCSAEHLRAWHDVNANEQGSERDLKEIAAIGRAEWGYLRVDGDSTCACGDCLDGEAGG
jgi:hypothetical protein